MAEAGAAHDRECHDADAAHRPGVNAGTWRHEPERGKAAQEEAQRHEGKADMQDQDEPVSERAITGPTGEPQRIEQGGGQQRHAGRRAVWRHHPEGEAGGAERHAELVEASKLRGHPARWAPHQPVAREARDDASADHCDQHDDESNSSACRDLGDALDVRLDVKGEVGDGEQAKHGHHHEVAPILAGDDLARHGRHHQRKERHIDQRGGKPAGLSRQ